MQASLEASLVTASPIDCGVSATRGAARNTGRLKLRRGRVRRQIGGDGDTAVLDPDFQPARGACRSSPAASRQRYDPGARRPRTSFVNTELTARWLPQPLRRMVGVDP